MILQTTTTVLDFERYEADKRQRIGEKKKITKGAQR